MSVKFDNKTKKTIKTAAKQMLVIFVTALNMLSGSENSNLVRDSSYMAMAASA